METPMKTETPPPEARRVAHWVEGGSTIEVLGGFAAVILAIAGLTHYAPLTMVAIASIVLGGSLFLQGALVAAEYNEILAKLEGGPYDEFGAGLGAEALAGVAGMVLGILALFDVSPHILMGIAAIVLGAGLVLSSGVASRLNSVKIDVSTGSAEAKTAARRAVTASSLTLVVIGLSAAVLGVLAVINISADMLSLIAMLGIGVALLYSGGAVMGRMFSMTKR